MGTEVLTDEELAAQAAAGSRQAIESLFERYFDRVYDLVLGMVRHRETAADVAQTTFLKMMEHLRSSPPPRGFRAWLYTIARNAAMDEFRRNKRLAPMPALVTDEGEELAIEPEAPAVWAEPERVVADEETVNLVWEATAGLNPDDHALLDLHLRKGLEPNEIAAVLGSAPGAVYTRLSRLRAALEASVTALLLYRRRRDCQELDQLVQRYAEPDLTPRLRKAINRHLEDCSDCQLSRKGFVTAGALFASMPIVAAPPELKAAVLSRALGPGADRPAEPSTDRADRSAALRSATGLKAVLGAVAAAGLFAAGWLTGTAWQGRAPAPDAAGPAPAETAAPSAYVTSFRLRDPASGSGEVTRSLTLRVEAQVEGRAAGWILTEQSQPPGPADPRWAPALPADLQLPPGEGARTLYLWAKDQAGRVTVSRTAVLVDTVAPEAPSGLQSATHAPGRATPLSHITVTWAPAADPAPGSGLAGYMAAWSGTGGQEPTGVNLGPDAREATSAALPPGEWWFVIRPVDRAGNAGPAVRSGPYLLAPPRVEPTRPIEATPAPQPAPPPGTRR